MTGNNVQDQRSCIKGRNVRLRNTQQSKVEILTFKCSHSLSCNDIVPVQHSPYANNGFCLLEKQCPSRNIYGDCARVVPHVQPNFTLQCADEHEFAVPRQPHKPKSSVIDLQATSVILLRPLDLLNWFVCNGTFDSGVNEHQLSS